MIALAMIYTMEDFLIPPKEKDAETNLGGGFSVVLSKGGGYAWVYKHGYLHQDCRLEKKVDKRVLLTDLVEHGAKKSWVAQAFGISRQTLDNYIETRKKWGLEGLVNNGKSR